MKPAFADLDPRTAPPEVDPSGPVSVRVNVPQGRARESGTGLRLRPVPEGRELFDLVYRQMRSLVAGSQRDLDELVQVALEQILRSLPNFEHRSQFSTWSYGICYRTLLKYDRWYRRWLRRFTLTSEGILPEPTISGPTPAEQLERMRRVRALRLAITQLPPKRRAALVLVDLEGRSTEEAAQITGTGVNTMRSRVRDGRRQLAEMLAGDPQLSDLVAPRREEP